jgi:hypothetical protein
MDPNEPPRDYDSGFRMLEPFEWDCSGGQPIDPAQYGRTETSINLLPAIEIDFAVPHLILTVRLADGPIDAAEVGLDVYHLIEALSGYEKAIGGRGLYLFSKKVDGRTITLNLRPVGVDKAGERLADIVKVLADARAGSSNPGHGPALSEESLDRTLSSPAERLKRTTARRDWQVEGRIDRPIAA